MGMVGRGMMVVVVSGGGEVVGPETVVIGGLLHAIRLFCSGRDHVVSATGSTSSSASSRG